MVLVIVASVGLWPFRSARAEDTDRDPKRVAVFISREIKPYLQAADEMGRTLDKTESYRLSQHLLDPDDPDEAQSMVAQVQDEAYDLVVTVGPEASSIMASSGLLASVPTVFTMLLNPESLFDAQDGVCGVPLNIPIGIQLEAIKTTLPWIHAIGILFDPENNDRFVAEARISGASLGLDVMAIEVADKASIPGALERHWDEVEVLWMIPDQTVISVGIIQYVIKEALLRDVPVIGYNRSFHEYGAALAFILDYEQIGRQTAEVVIDRLENGVCRDDAPYYETAVNRKVLRHVGAGAEGSEEASGEGL